MINFISCLFFVCFLIGTDECSDERIVGGSTAPDGAHPYIVSIRENNSHNCGGSIISKRCILTAAHCLRRRNIKITSIVAGTNFLSETGDQYLIETIHQHPNFDSNTNENDVGLAVLKKNIVFNKKVQPIKVHGRNITGSNFFVTLAGWGKLKLNGKNPNALQQINLRVLANEQCKVPGHNITESMLCTYNKRGEGACKGDSGGPLVFHGAQIGIFSFGKPCAIGYPDVFIRVAMFRKWIKSHCSGI